MLKQLAAWCGLANKKLLRLRNILENVLTRNCCILFDAVLRKCRDFIFVFFVGVHVCER